MVTVRSEAAKRLISVSRRATGSRGGAAEALEVCAVMAGRLRARRAEAWDVIHFFEPPR